VAPLINGRSHEQASVPLNLPRTRGILPPVFEHAPRLESDPWGRSHSGHGVAFYMKKVKVFTRKHTAPNQEATMLSRMWGKVRRGVTQSRTGVTILAGALAVLALWMIAGQVPVGASSTLGTIKGYGTAGFISKFLDS
jgi:hypothetical protein